MAVHAHIPNLVTASVGTPITRVGVSFFPIYLHGNDLPEIATGECSGLKIEELESAEVPSLAVTNTTESPILIVEGEHFVGGKQNRSVNVTVLVPAETRLQIPVTCLEEGRWGHARPYKRGRAFAPSRLRAVNQDAVYASMRRGGTRDGDQAAAWDGVSQLLGDLATDSATSAYAAADDIYRRDTKRRRAMKELSGLGPLPDQHGVAVSHGRRISAIDLFGSPELLACHWRAVIRAHLLEVVRPEGRPSVSQMLSAVRELGTLRPDNSPGIGLGLEQRVRSRRLVGQLLTLDKSVVHGSAFARVTRRRPTRPRRTGAPGGRPTDFGAPPSASAG